MFGKSKNNPSNGEVALKVIHDLLQVQLALGGVFQGKAKLDTWALGYVFGLSDAVLQGLGISNQTESLAIMASAYIKLFGQDAGASVLRKCLDLQRDQTFMQGVFTGGNEATAFRRAQTPPLGLSTHLQH